MGSRKGIRPVKTEWWGADVVICLERGADLHMAQLMPLPLTVSCFSKIQIGFTFLVPAHPVVPDEGPLNGCVYILVVLFFYRAMLFMRGTSHGPVSVRPSVTSQCSTKTAKRRITQTTLHDSPGTLVSRRQRFPRNSTRVTLYGGTKCRWGGSKSATFDK